MFVEWNLRGKTKARDREFFEFHETKKQRKKVHYKSIVARESDTPRRNNNEHMPQVEVDIDLLAAQPVVTVQSERWNE